MSDLVALEGSANSGPLRSGIPKVMHTVARWFVPIVIGFMFLVPLVTHSDLDLQVLMIAFLNAAAAAGLTLSLGYTGVLNFSQGTFYGLGAYTTAVLVTEHGVPFGLAMLAAAAVSGLGGWLFSLTTTRVKGDYFALVSIALTIAFAQLCANLPSVTRGREGFFGLPDMSLFGLSFGSSLGTYYLVLSMFAIVYLLIARLVGTFYGRSMLTVRYNDVAARSMAIPVFTTKAISITVGAAVAGLAGAFLVGSIQFIRPEDFGFNPSFMISLYVIIGGVGTLPGVVIVTLLLVWLQEKFRNLGDYSTGVLGFVVIIAVFWRAGVLGDIWWRLRQRFSIRSASRKDVADADV
jgi:branched-chain amino acid transport system permease protein